MYVHVCIQMYICIHVTIITKEMNFGGGNIGGTQGGSDAYVVIMYKDKEASGQREAYRDILKSITSQIYPSASSLQYHFVSSDTYLATEMIVDSVISTFLSSFQFFSSFHMCERLTNV